MRKKKTNAICYLTHSLVIVVAGVGREASDDELRVEQLRRVLQLVVVDYTGALRKNNTLSEKPNLSVVLAEGTHGIHAIWHALKVNRGRRDALLGRHVTVSKTAQI